MSQAPVPPPDPTALIVPFPPRRRPLAVPSERPPLRALPGGAEPSRAGRRPPLRVVPRGEAGQASVELVVLLPMIAVILAVAWQALLAGEALWQARASARAAARANAIGADAGAAAR